MKVLVDINVMLDFLQRREPFCRDAARFIDAVHSHEIEAAIAGHSVTTLHYFLRKGADPATVVDALRWIVRTFEIVPTSALIFTKAIESEMADYEDAVTGQCAAAAGCEYIVTRDRRGFVGSPVPAQTPAEILGFIQKH